MSRRRRREEEEEEEEKGGGGGGGRGRRRKRLLRITPPAPSLWRIYHLALEKVRGKRAAPHACGPQREPDPM
jgi:hypothetical protein